MIINQIAIICGVYNEVIIKGVVEETPWGDNPYPFCKLPYFVWGQH